jgi:hypothetical protein
MAALEKASIASFERLARELTAHRAPPSLIRAARRSASDERRHARRVWGLARAHGAREVRFAPVERSIRPLAEVALENATSGCVLETYGAVEAAWQAEHALDPKVRKTMRSIAPDEARHARLAWWIDSWAQLQLNAADRGRITRARRSAVRELWSDVPSDPTASVLGIPTGAAKGELLALLGQSVWANALN